METKFRGGSPPGRTGWSSRPTLRRKGALRKSARARGHLPTQASLEGVRDGIASKSIPREIPNNVNLTEDRRVLKALRSWHPGYIDWCNYLGRRASGVAGVICAPLSSVDPKAGAKFDIHQMRNTGLGHPAGASEENRTSPFGAHKWERYWQDLPRRYRVHAAAPRCHPGATEARLVEQAAHLGKTRAVALRHAHCFRSTSRRPAPLFDGLLLAQVFRPLRPRRGRRHAGGRRSGSADSPRISRLPREDPDWLSLFIFTSSPLATASAARVAGAVRFRSAVAHLPVHADAKEAHHMFRSAKQASAAVVQRTC